ncbi:unnamed protein product [Brassica napus]|uniref:(rape) hypothetical protein n=1 Tax=Brassica napus TaxID=3708 RepID=A0A816LVA9_BRANA|nr:unnamed protein product [Brassica napus]
MFVYSPSHPVRLDLTVAASRAAPLKPSFHRSSYYRRASIKSTWRSLPEPPKHPLHRVETTNHLSSFTLFLNIGELHRLNRDLIQQIKTANHRNHEPITTPDPESGTNPYPTKRLKHLKPATQDYESLHPPETKAGVGGAEEAPTSRRLGRRRRSWISLHLPDSKLKLTSLLHHTKTLHTTASLFQPLSHHRCRFTPRVDDDGWELDKSSDKAIGDSRRRRTKVTTKSHRLFYRRRRSVNSRPPLATTFLNRRHADELAGLAFMFSSSILLQILACAIYSNWWPMLSALMYVVVPMPCMFFGGGSTQFLISRDGGGWIDAAKFLTGASTVGSLAIPIILRHAGMIETGAMLIEFTSFFIFICTVMCFHRASLDDDW